MKSLAKDFFFSNFGCSPYLIFLMLRCQRDNLTILRERNVPRSKQKRSTDGTFITSDKRVELIEEKGLQPEFFVNFLPIVSISSWKKELMKTSQLSVKAAISSLENAVKKAQNMFNNSEQRATELVEEYNQIEARICTYKGRGLREYRKTFFLMSYLARLRTKKEYIIISESDNIIKHVNSLITVLNRPIHYENIYFACDIEGYISSKPGNSAQIKKYTKKIAFLEEFVKWPNFLPPPTDFVEQLIYPTCDTYKVLKKMAENAQTKSIEKIFEEFHEMTDDFEEFVILLDHAFDMGWTTVDFPYLCMQPGKIKLFLKVTPRALNVDYIPEEFMDVTINELQGRHWPYSSVVDIMISILFETNPVRMANIFNTSLEEISIVIDRLYPDHDDIDFDTVFSIAVLALMASGILAEEKILAYISQISLLEISNTFTQIGATYAATALNHILSLDEDELTNIS